ncbi:hypothetical protein ABIF21_004152 [Bradyrhizobium elkanii]
MPGFFFGARRITASLDSVGRIRLALQPMREGSDVSGKLALQPADVKPLVTRLRRVEVWRRDRLKRLLNEHEPDRSKRIHAAQLYIDVAARRMAAERGLIS